MLKGAVGLLLIIVFTLLILLVIFLTTKFIVPNPQTVEEDKKIQQDAQETVNKAIQKSIQNQTIEAE